MKVGIVGLPASGKTTLFRALTRGTVPIDEYGGKPHIGVVPVPDARLVPLVEEYKPKKVTYASIEFIDGAARIGHDDGRARFGSDFFSDVRQVDALIHVIRAFPGPAGESPTPVQDLQTLSDELVLSDMQVIENRMERVERQLHGVKKGMTTPATIEMEMLDRLHAALESGGALKDIEMSAEEEKSVRAYDFLTLKPLIAVLNVPEGEVGAPSDHTSAFRSHCQAAGIPVVELCAKMEMEVSELSDEEEAEFLLSMGIERPARDVLIRECYSALGLISFITAGEPEVKAWTIKAGSKAIDAAGAIHSDLARGFIRIEVANAGVVEDVGGWEAAKQKGVTQLHGKDYIMQDGDVVYIRFKV